MVKPFRTYDLKTRQGSFDSRQAVQGQHSPERTHTYTRPKLSEQASPYYPSITDVRQIRGSKFAFNAFAPYVFFNVPTHSVSRSFPFFLKKK